MGHAFLQVGSVKLVVNRNGHVTIFEINKFAGKMEIWNPDYNKCPKNHMPRNPDFGHIMAQLKQKSEIFVLV